jgi:hypothetical protein
MHGSTCISLSQLHRLDSAMSHVAAGGMTSQIAGNAATISTPGATPEKVLARYLSAVSYGEAIRYTDYPSCRRVVGGNPQVEA